MTRAHDPNDDSFSTLDGVVRDADGRVQRRTLVAGAAWTIPVVAVAVATPAAAASLQPTLEFVNGPYSITTCATLGPIVLHTTADGTAPAPFGTVVTVTLPTGLTFSDGSTTKPFTTDASGDITITGIIATDSATTGTITALMGTVSASATITVTRTGVVNRALDGTPWFDGGAIPADAVAIGGDYFLTPGGDLYFSDGTLIDTGVSSADGQFTLDSNRAQHQIAWYNKGGIVNRAFDGAPWHDGGAIPTDAVSVGGEYFLTPGGDLYFSDGTLIDTGVSSADGQFTLDSNNAQHNIAWYNKGVVC